MCYYIDELEVDFMKKDFISKNLEAQLHILLE